MRICLVQEVGGLANKRVGVAKEKADRAFSEGRHRRYSFLFLQRRKTASGSVGCLLKISYAELVCPKIDFLLVFLAMKFRIAHLMTLSVDLSGTTANKLSISLSVEKVKLGFFLLKTIWSLQCPSGILTN